MTEGLEFLALEIEIPYNPVFITTQGCHSMVFNQLVQIFKPVVSLNETNNHKFTMCVEIHKD